MYKKFSFMMITSFIIMYLVMFLNVSSMDHVSFSLTRTYMTLLMVAPMAVTMLLFMRDMYPNKHMNMGIIIGAVVVFGASLFGLRNQYFIRDVQWMKAMIPHHSSAILTSTYADFDDTEVQQLANDIIEAQEREINQMKSLIEKLQKNSE